MLIHDACGHECRPVATCSHCGERLGRDTHIVPGPGCTDPSFVGEGRPAERPGAEVGAG